MADKTNLPKDLQKEFEESGITFDENGNIIDEWEDASQLENTNEEEPEKPQEIEEPDSEENEEPEEVEELEEPDSEENEEPEEEQPVKKKKLTPLDKKVEEKPDSNAEMLEKQQKLLDKLNELGDNTQRDFNTPASNDEAQRVLEELRREAQAFKNMRAKEFASNIRKNVNNMVKDDDMSFDDIIQSKEWTEFLHSRAYGMKIGSLYINAIDEQDFDSVVGFFEDFKRKYIDDDITGNSSSSKTSSKPKKPSLEDIAVPEKTKTIKTIKKIKPYDFEYSDYDYQLNLLERGKISQKQFNEFVTKFEKADKLGRVK